MNDAPPTILCVGDARAPDQQPWPERLEQAGLRAERVSDVYLALARLGRHRVDPVAVIVCVDFLRPSEFEFFELVARYHRQTAIYACGCAEAADKLEAALRAGAREVLTPARFERLLQELGPGPEESVEAADEAPRSAAAARAQVPWRKRAGGPVRTPPRRRERPEPDQSVPEPAECAAEEARPGNEAEADIFDGPLLSPEELDLLMRDDVRTRPDRLGDREEERE